ncbi:MAG TPA: carotenoid oxygenase family protein [Solirubrobacterales bacterium]|nr:carotenoid oxygenase family protein [Solirubrobacterales bacterium]
MATSLARPTDYALSFSSLNSEVVRGELPQSGELPSWLNGSLLRIGPARFEVGERQMSHWFDGQAMLHDFTVGGGKVAYANRFLEGRSYRAAKEKGEMAYGEFATDPCRSLFKRAQAFFAPGTAFSDNASINVTKLGDRFIAMTETPLPVEFDPDTLAAVGVGPAYEVPGHLTTAHPHWDRNSGAMLNYAAKLGVRSSYRFFELGADTPEPTVVGSVPVREPSYMHSFGLSERWYVLAEFPFVVNPLDLARLNRPYIENYRWQPERGTRFTLVDRHSGEAVGGFETEACFGFHHVNAYDGADEVIVDLCVFPDATVIEDLYLERLRAGKPIPSAELVRFRLDLDRKTVVRNSLSEQGLELPRINYELCNTLPHRYVWGIDTGDSGWIEQIVKVDTDDGSAILWSRPGCTPSEPVFVARPGAREEDDGVLLSVVLDSERGTSSLLVLDASNLEEIASAEAPHHIPYSFHGQFFGD